MAIIRAIVAGEHDPQVLAGKKHRYCSSLLRGFFTNFGQLEEIIQILVWIIMSSVIVSEWLIISTKKPRLLVLSLFLSSQKIWFLRSTPTGGDRHPLRMKETLRPKKSSINQGFSSCFLKAPHWRHATCY